MSDKFRPDFSDASRSLPESLRENLERAIDIGSAFSLVRLPDQVPLDALEECVKAKRGVVDRFRLLRGEEIVGGKRWDYGVIDAIDRALSLQRSGSTYEQIEAKISEASPGDTVRLVSSLLRGEEPCTAILITPNPGTKIADLDGSFFQLLHYGRDSIFPLLRKNNVSLFLAAEGESGFLALQSAMTMTKDLNSIRDLPISA